MISKASSIAKLVKEKRTQMGLSQAKFSTLLGMNDGNKKSGQYLSNIERGLCQFPAHRLPLLCTLIEVDSGEIQQRYINDVRVCLSDIFDKYNQN